MKVRTGVLAIALGDKVADGAATGPPREAREAFIHPKSAGEPPLARKAMCGARYSRTVPADWVPVLYKFSRWCDWRAGNLLGVRRSCRLTIHTDFIQMTCRPPARAKTRAGDCNGETFGLPSLAVPVF